MAFTSIPSADVTAGKPLKQGLQQTIKDNFDDLNSRVAALTDDVGVVTVFNQMLKFPEIPVGSAIWGYDTLANSQSQGLSSNWVSCVGTGTWDDGAGSTHNVPDARNRFLRMASTYSSVNVTDLVADSTAANGLTVNTNSQSNSTTTLQGSHNHIWYRSENTAVNAATFNSASGIIDINSATGSGFKGIQVSTSTSDAKLSADASSGTQDLLYTSLPNTYGDQNHAHFFSHTHGTSITGDSETAPIHIKQNLIFKKAHTWGSYRLMFKSPSSFTINTVNLTQLDPGSNSSVLTVDVRKGTITQLRASSDVSVLSTLPSITSDGSTSFVEADGTHPGSGSTVAPVIKSDGSEIVSTNDYLYLDVTSKQSGGSEFFIQVIGA